MSLGDQSCSFACHISAQLFEDLIATFSVITSASNTSRPELWCQPVAARQAEAGGYLEPRSSRPDQKTQMRSCLTKQPCLLENGVGETALCCWWVYVGGAVILDGFACLFSRVPFHFQVSQEKGSCSFQRNPTPCVIPQEQENIFHTIFAFFTKSGRKVLVRNYLVTGTMKVWAHREGTLETRGQSSAWHFLFLKYGFADSKRLKDCDQILFFCLGFQSKRYMKNSTAHQAGCK